MALTHKVKIQATHTFSFLFIFFFFAVGFTQRDSVHSMNIHQGGARFSFPAEISSQFLFFLLYVFLSFVFLFSLACTRQCTHTHIQKTTSLFGTDHAIGLHPTCMHTHRSGTTTKLKKNVETNIKRIKIINCRH